MKLSRAQKNVLTSLGVAAATFAVTVVLSKKEIRRRCHRQVRREVSKIPFVSDEFVERQAQEICQV